MANLNSTVQVIPPPAHSVMMSTISMDVQGQWPECMQDGICLYLPQSHSLLGCYCDDYLFRPFVRQQIVAVTFHSDWTDEGAGSRQRSFSIILSVVAIFIILIISFSIVYVPLAHHPSRLKRLVGRDWRLEAISIYHLCICLYRRHHHHHHRHLFLQQTPFSVLDCCFVTREYRYSVSVFSCTVLPTS